MDSERYLELYLHTSQLYLESARLLHCILMVISKMKTFSNYIKPFTNICSAMSCKGTWLVFISWLFCSVKLQKTTAQTLTHVLKIQRS